jgi:hypothetical protein
MIEIPAINPISCTALRTCLAIMGFSPKNIRAARAILKPRAQHATAALLLVKKPLNQSLQVCFALRQAHF